MNRLQILYFASLRERLQRDRDQVDIDVDVRTVADLKRWLGTHDPALGAVLRDTPNLRVAVDQQLAGDDTPVTGATEVAFFPPVTGG